MTDNLRGEQIKLARRGAECRRFMAGIGGAAVQQMRETVIDQLGRLPPGKRHDDTRYRLTVSLKIISDFSDTILRCAVQGEEATVAIKRWSGERRGIFDGR